MKQWIIESYQHCDGYRCWRSIWWWWWWVSVTTKPRVISTTRIFICNYIITCWFTITEITHNPPLRCQYQVSSIMKINFQIFTKPLLILTQNFTISFFSNICRHCQLCFSFQKYSLQTLCVRFWWRGNRFDQIFWIMSSVVSCSWVCRSHSW